MQCTFLATSYLLTGLPPGDIRPERRRSLAEATELKVEPDITIFFSKTYCHLRDPLDLYGVLRATSLGLSHSGLSHLQISPASLVVVRDDCEHEGILCLYGLTVNEWAVR